MFGHKKYIYIWSGRYYENWIKEPKYQTWPKQNKICMYLRRFGLRIFGTPLAAILYLVIKSWTNVAEMYFI